MTQETAEHVGALLRDARGQKGWTQGQLAAELGTSQSAIARMEQGKQNLSLKMIQRLESIFGRSIVKVGRPAMTHLRVEGGRTLSGSVDVNSSKNAGVALLCASLINRGTTTLRRLARIEEVNRIVEVLTSIGVDCTWLNANDLQIRRPAVLDLDSMDVEAARRTRSVIMLLGPLLDESSEYRLPYAGGCDLGTRTVQPHMQALRQFGLSVEAKSGFYAVQAPPVGRARPLLRAQRTRRHRHRKRHHGRRPPQRHHGHPQRQPQLHGAGPLLLPADARRRDRRRGHHHAEDRRPSRRSTPTSSTSRPRTRSRR